MPEFYICAAGSENDLYVISNRAGLYVRTINDHGVATDFTRKRDEAARFDRVSAICSPLVRYAREPAMYFEPSGPAELNHA